MKLYLALALLAACGPGGSSHDAGPTDARENPGEDTRQIDSAMSDCSYQESNDAANDTTEGGNAEASGVSLQTGATICGSFASNHFDGDITVDVDAYRFTTTTDLDLVVRLVSD